MLAKQIRCISTVSLGHVYEGRKVQKKASKLKSIFERLFSASRSCDGGPKVPRRGPQARLLAFLQGEMRRPDPLHIYSIPHTFAQNPLRTCRRSVSRTATASPKDRAASFPFQRAPRVLAGAPGKCFANPKWPRRWPPARIPASLRCPVASSKRAETFLEKKSS